MYRAVDFFSFLLFNFNNRRWCYALNTYSFTFHCHTYSVNMKNCSLTTFIKAYTHSHARTHTIGCENQPIDLTAISGEWPTFWRLIVITKYIHCIPLCMPCVRHAMQLSSRQLRAPNWLKVRWMWRQMKHVKLLKYQMSDTVTLCVCLFLLILELERTTSKTIFNKPDTFSHSVDAYDTIQYIWWNKINLSNKLTNNCFACSAHRTL